VDEHLFQLITEFQARAAEACRLLREHLQLENPMMWRPSTPQIGSRGTTARYAYHGSGVAVTFADGRKIDFDFGFDGRCNGFSPWKLASLAGELGGAFQRFEGWLSLKALMDAEVKDGGISRPFHAQQDDLYYLGPSSNST